MSLEIKYLPNPRATDKMWHKVILSSVNLGLIQFYFFLTGYLTLLKKMFLQLIAIFFK